MAGGPFHEFAAHMCNLRIYLFITLGEWPWLHSSNTQESYRIHPTEAHPKYAYLPQGSTSDATENATTSTVPAVLPGTSTRPPSTTTFWAVLTRSTLPPASVSKTVLRCRHLRSSIISKRKKKRKMFEKCKITAMICNISISVGGMYYIDKDQCNCRLTGYGLVRTVFSSKLNVKLSEFMAVKRVS